MRLPLHVKLHYNNGTVEIIELPSVPRERAGCEIERQLTYATADNGGGEGDIVSFGTPGLFPLNCSNIKVEQSLLIRLLAGRTIELLARRVNFSIMYFKYPDNNTGRSM